MLDSDHRPPLDRATSFKAGARSAGSPLPASADRKYPTLGFRKRMVGFQLAYEQFPVNELAELGVALEQAGFDVMTHSDHLQPWRKSRPLRASVAHYELDWRAHKENRHGHHRHLPVLSI
jgi:hypothetical protein